MAQNWAGLGAKRKRSRVWAELHADVRRAQVLHVGFLLQAAGRVPVLLGAVIRGGARCPVGHAQRVADLLEGAREGGAGRARQAQRTPFRH